MKLKPYHIVEEWNEGHPEDGGDGYWIALKSGWKSEEDTVGAVHTIHENTRRECYQVGVLRCECPDCKPSLLVAPNIKGNRRGSSAVA